MELLFFCCSSAATFTPTYHLQFKPSISLSLSNPQLNNKRFFSTSPNKLSLSSRQFSLLHPASPRIAAAAAAAASSSSTDLDTLVDPLPADIDVKQTQEPNSRVRRSLSSILIIIFIFI